MVDCLFQQIVNKVAGVEDASLEPRSLMLG